MATITFYEKTGCINNTKQKKILEMAGHKVNSIHIIQYDWTREELLDFFKGLPVKEWFNKNAPSVQSGEVLPDTFDEDSALDAMLDEHLLIRRPLMVIDGEKFVGFNKELLDEKIGLNPNSSPQIVSLLNENLSDCPQKAKNTQCD